MSNDVLQVTLSSELQKSEDYWNSLTKENRTVLREIHQLQKLIHQLIFSSYLGKKKKLELLILIEHYHNLGIRYGQVGVGK